MKILIVSDAWSPQVNGVVRTLQNTRDQLMARGHQVQMITPDQFKTFPCPTYPEIQLAWLPGRGIRKIIESFEPDCLHIATEGPLGWSARRLALRLNIPFTTAYHTRFPEYVHARFKIPLNVSYALFRYFHQPSSGVMVATDSMTRELVNRGFTRIKRWGRGVDLQRFQNPQLGFESVNTPPPNKDPIFLFAGRVAVEKNIEAFLSLDLPGQKWVAGDGPQREELQARYPEVNWLGMLNQEQLAKVYSQADVFVFPSLTDTFGLVMLEAMACGLPVAAFPVTGPIDVVSNNQVGALDKDLLTACLKAMKLKKQDAQKFANQFSWANCTDQFLANLQPIEKAKKAQKRIESKRLSVSN